METFKLKALNCFIGGKVYKKEDQTVFNLVDFPKDEILKAVKDGFLIQEVEKVDIKKPKNKANEV